MIAKNRLRFCLLVLILAGMDKGAWAQEAAPEAGWESEQGGRSFLTDRITVPTWRLRGGPQVRLAFREVVAEAREVTVRVRCEGEDIALGALVGGEGWVLTKASQLRGAIRCRLTDSREFEAQVVGVNRDFDLALLKIDAEGLPAFELEALATPQVGSWLATVGMDRSPLAVGVMSVGPREIWHQEGTLGVRLEKTSERPRIAEVFSETGASEAGLLADDLVLSLEGQPTPTREVFVRWVRGYHPGDRLVLQVQRGDETLSVEAVLTEQRPWRTETREEFQNQLGSQLSKRRFGFPLAFQHDTVVTPSDCGGPVVNLDGELVGLNIARAGRTETYAIGVSTLARLYEELKLMRGANRH